MNGLREDVSPVLAVGQVVREGALVRAAGPLLDEVRGELAETSFVLTLADRNARIVDIHCGDAAYRRELAATGLVPGVQLGEEQVGTNAVGTPLETREALLVCGPDHFLAEFHPFMCYGHPIVHPITSRLEGVLCLGGRAGQEHMLISPLVQRTVRDIEERLLLDSSRAQQRLLAGFQEAARSPRRPVLVVGQGLVLATPAALDLLEPADHAALQACVEELGPEGLRGSGADSRGRATHLTLTDGRTVGLRCTPLDGAEGVLVEVVPDLVERSRPNALGTPAGWPLLIVGEPGSGRTTEARQAAGQEAVAVDATDVVRQGEQAWAKGLTALLGREGPPLIVENVQFLSEPLTSQVADLLRGTRRRTVLTSTPGDHVNGTHASLAALCNARRDLVPLRRRKHDVPRLAERILAEVLAEAGTSGRLRFTADSLRVLAVQPWPGNLAELRRVIRTVAGGRSAGDVTPADLPASHRNEPAPISPFKQAEREIIVAALQAAGGNKLRAARTLGVSRSTLYNRMRALRIS